MLLEDIPLTRPLKKSCFSSSVHWRRDDDVDDVALASLATTWAALALKDNGAGGSGGGLKDTSFATPCCAPLFT